MGQTVIRVIRPMVGSGEQMGNPSVSPPTDYLTDDSDIPLSTEVSASDFLTPN